MNVKALLRTLPLALPATRKRMLKREDFNNDKVDAGEIGADAQLPPPPSCCRASGPELFAPPTDQANLPATTRFALPSHPMDAAVDPDAMLMLAYARGGLAAFEALYARYRGMLYRFLLRSVRDPHRTDELFQETWSRVISARARSQSQAKFSTWLLQIAHNLMIDNARRQRPMAEGDEAEAALARRARLQQP